MSGRPRGSRNLNLPIVRVPARQCAHCHSSALLETMSAVSKIIFFQKVIWRRILCRVCGGKFIEREARDFVREPAVPSWRATKKQGNPPP